MHGGIALAAALLLSTMASGCAAQPQSPGAPPFGSLSRPGVSWQRTNVAITSFTGRPREEDDRVADAGIQTAWKAMCGISPAKPCRPVDEYTVSLFVFEDHLTVGFYTPDRFREDKAHVQHALFECRPAEGCRLTEWY